MNLGIQRTSWTLGVPFQAQVSQDDLRGGTWGRLTLNSSNVPGTTAQNSKMIPSAVMMRFLVPSPMSRKGLGTGSVKTGVLLRDLVSLPLPALPRACVRACVRARSGSPEASICVAGCRSRREELALLPVFWKKQGRGNARVSALPTHCAHGGKYHRSVLICCFLSLGTNTSPCGSCLLPGRTIGLWYPGQDPVASGARCCWTEG